jgi:peptide/nickel transport system ATP-binding protein
MIFQDPLMSLNPLRKIGDQLVETILTHMNISKSEAIKKAKNGLKEVGIDPSRLNSYPHTFSGGMRQRVVIALALAPEPSLIIADEPTTALDVSVQAQILDLLKKLCKERGTSIILVTHDMGVIAETTDRVGVLYAGRLAEIGNTREVLTDPKHPYTRGLVESTPRIDSNSFQKTLFQIPGSMPKLDAMPSGCAFHPRCEFSSDICTKKIPPMLRNRSACWLLDDGEL